MLSGGEMFKIWAFLPFLALSMRCGKQACDVKYVPRTLMPIMRSYLKKEFKWEGFWGTHFENLFIGVSVVGLNQIAEALLTRISIPPNFSTAFFTASVTWDSSLISTLKGKAIVHKNAFSNRCEHCGWYCNLFLRVAQFLLPQWRLFLAISDVVPLFLQQAQHLHLLVQLLRFEIQKIGGVLPKKWAKTKKKPFGNRSSNSSRCTCYKESDSPHLVIWLKCACQICQ